MPNDETNRQKIAALKASVGDIAVSIRDLCDILLDHERRLEEIEKAPCDLTREMKIVETKIQTILDERTRKQAYDIFSQLCALLNVDLSSGP